MTAPDDLRILRAAEHHARSVSKEFDAHVIDCAGSLKPMVLPGGGHVLLGNTPDSTVCICLDGADIELRRMGMVPGTAIPAQQTLRVPLPGHLRRQLSRFKVTS